MNDGGVYPAQHIILLKANHRKQQLFGTGDPCPYNKFNLKKQIYHWRLRMIARNLDYEIYSSSNYKLITKDNSKKNHLYKCLSWSSSFIPNPIFLSCRYIKRITFKKSNLERNFKKILLEMLSEKILRIFCTIISLYICLLVFIQ